jgi:uncharacterized iron-regulated membrane protein
LLLRLHRWSGLLAALVGVVAGLTGSMLVYQGEIDAWLNPELLQVESATHTQALDRLVAAAERARPGTQVTGLRLPRSAGDSIEISVEPRGADPFDGWHVYLDPHRGHLLGTRPFDPDPWSRRGIVASLFEVHYSLAASRPGVWLVSGSAILLIVTTLCGVWLAWPRGTGWREALRLRLDGDVSAISANLHRGIGLLCAVLLTLTLGTGLVLNQSGQAVALVQQFSTRTFEPQLAARIVDRAAADVGWQGAVDAARRHAPDHRAYAVSRDNERGLYVVRMREPAAIQRRGQLRVFIAAEDARVLAAWNPRQGSAGDRFMAWQNPLHSGQAFGGVGRMLVCLTGLAMALLAVTGILQWCARRRA